MKSINLAIKTKRNIPQEADSAANEFETVLTLFETFRKEEKARSQLFAFRDEYIHTLIMLLQFVKAERTNNWHLYLQSVSAMITYFFAHVAEMQELEPKHPELYKESLEVQRAISRWSQPFPCSWTDMTLAYH